MLESVNLSRKLPKQDYKRRMPVLQSRLHQLQRACWEKKLASVIVFEGWDAASKGGAIAKLTERLEPRGFELHALRAPRSYRRGMPWMWRFWEKIPEYGKIGLFDRSWYVRVLGERVEGTTPESAWRQAYQEINAFERTLSDDRYAIVKFFLHIDKAEQKKRLRALEKDPLMSWKVEPEDWRHHEKYDEYYVAIEEMLEKTDTHHAPWTIVEAKDRRYARVKIFETILSRLEEGLSLRELRVPEYTEPEDLDRPDEDLDI